MFVAAYAGSAPRRHYNRQYMRPMRLLAVLAHPDDESLGVGGTLAKYASEGCEVSLLTATRGGAGR